MGIHAAMMPSHHVVQMTMSNEPYGHQLSFMGLVQDWVVWGCREWGAWAQEGRDISASFFVAAAVTSPSCHAADRIMSCIS